MNRKRREILAALAPAVEFARQAGAAALYGERRDVPGLHMTPRVSAQAPAELLIYGPIGGGPFDGGISASDVAAVLREAGPGPVNVRINSPGGDVFQGVAIHSLLARHPGVVTTYVDGLAASAASFIMLAGDHIVCARNAMVMIHDGMTYTYGNKATHDRAGELLDMVSANIADMYAERAGEDAEHWRTQMTVNGEDGTWYTGVKAFDAGLVDSITEAPDEDEDRMVWDRVRTWADRMPAAVRAEIPAEPEPEDDEPEAPVAQPAPLAEPDEAEAEADTEADADKDFAHSMSMWAYLQGHGHPARKVAA